MDAHKEAGAMGAKLLNPDRTLQHSIYNFPNVVLALFSLFSPHNLLPVFRLSYIRYWDKHDKTKAVDYVSGACLMVRQKTIKEIGILDEGFWMLFEEVDWCYRIKKAGWQIWFTPSAKVLHHYGQSIKQVKVSMILSSHRGLYRFWKKHYRGNRWYLDGFANAGLMSLASLKGDDPSVT